MTNSKLKLNLSKTEFIMIGSKNQIEKFKDLFPILLLDDDTLWDLFLIVILTSNDKSPRLAKYASIRSGTFGVLGSTLAQKLQNLLHLL